MGLLRNAEHKIDVLFTDIVLPRGMNGVQIAEAALLARPDLSVLFTSGYDRNALAQHGRLSAGVEVITKPYGCSELTTRVQELVERRTRVTAGAESVSG